MKSSGYDIDDECDGEERKSFDQIGSTCGPLSPVRFVSVTKCCGGGWVKDHRPVQSANITPNADILAEYIYDDTAILLTNIV